ncbi:hypothetical protein GCM10028857_02220 [Salinarchaeum chitinilyticum]
MTQSPTDAQRDPDRDPDRDPERARASTRTFDTDAMKWVSGIVSLIGLWIAASPFVYDTTTMATWNNAAVGLAIFLVAGFTYYQLAGGMFAAVGALSLVVLLGLWTVAAPYLMEFESNALLLSNVAAGGAVAVISAYNAYANREAQTAGMGTRA